jgi:hypothetical protein
MRLRILAAFLAAFLLLLVPSVQARAAGKGDAFFGYSRVGANLFAPNTPGMNGWQGSLNIRAVSIIGIEGDVSHYSQSPSGFSEQVTNVMFGPRATVGLAGFSVFAHALVGLAHEDATLTTYPSPLTPRRAWPLAAARISRCSWGSSCAPWAITSATAKRLHPGPRRPDTIASASALPTTFSS